MKRGLIIGIVIVGSFFIFGMLGFTGLAYAPALSTITLDGNVIVTDDLDVVGSISSPTITNLDSRLGILEGGS